MKLTRPILAWSLYDFADTSFSALFVSFFYPILIKKYLGGTEFHVGLVFGLSLILTALLVPLIGALSDALGRRMPLLIGSTVICVILTAFTGTVGLTAAIIIGILANFFNSIDIDLYDSYLTDLAVPEERGRVSGIGVAVGYLGTIASLAVAYVILSRIGFDTKAGISAMFPTVAIFYALFSLPMFLWIKDTTRRRQPLGHAGKKALSEIRYTLTHLKDMPSLGAFLLASFVYNDAMHTTIIFLSLFGTERIGLSIQQFFFVFAVMALFAFVGSLIFGHLSDRIGPKRTLLSILILWMFVILALVFVSNWQMFVIAGSLGGAALGGIWTCNRHMVTKLSPPNKIAEIFGFEGLTEKVAGVAGPIGFGFLAATYGYTAGLVYLLGFFILGWFILKRYVTRRGV